MSLPADVLLHRRSVVFLRAALGKHAVKQPAINVGSAFAVAADAALGATLKPAFSPYRVTVPPTISLWYPALDPKKVVKQALLSDAIWPQCVLEMGIADSTAIDLASLPHASS